MLSVADRCNDIFIFYSSIDILFLFCICMPIMFFLGDRTVSCRSSVIVVILFLLLQ